MTVQENLEIGAYVPKAKAERSRTLDLVYSIFPRLAERRKQLAGTMSGGEQQMLAVGRGLMLKPRLLMLDEPSLGLAPVMTDVTFEKIGEIHKMGTAILLVEQNVSRALSLVQRAYVLESGKVIMHGSSAELAGNKQVQAAYLGIWAPFPCRAIWASVQFPRREDEHRRDHASHAPTSELRSPPPASARRSRTFAEIRPSAPSIRRAAAGCRET